MIQVLFGSDCPERWVPINAAASWLHCRLAGSKGKLGVWSSAVGCTQNIKPFELSFGFSAVRPGSHSTRRITELLNQKLTVTGEAATVSHVLKFSSTLEDKPHGPGLSRQQEALQRHVGLSLPELPSLQEAADSYFY